MAGNMLTLEFAGDASKLQKAAKQAQAATDDVAAAAKNAGDDFQKSGKDSADFTTKLGSLGAGISGMSTAIDDATGTLDAFNQIQNASKERSKQHQRALQDVKQAQQDYNQALRDGKQATIDIDQAGVDLQQAQLDQATTQKAYTEAVKQHGKDSAEARQALIDMRQAGVDVKQAQEDQRQATEDASQATIDAKDAQLDLNDAQSEANPPDTAKWAQDLQTFAPLLTGLVGITGLVTAAQWAWNFAQLASPTTWIVLGILALVAVIVLIATKTTWFQRAWKASWKWIKEAAVDVWDWLKKVPGWIGDAFGKIVKFISLPFRTAFNLIADAWNNTIGRLSWTVPGWIPGIGGNTISVPHLPKFHSGGTVPGAPGSEMLAVLQAGETVTPAGRGGDQLVHVTVKIDRDTLLDIIAKGNRRGGPKVA